MAFVLLEVDGVALDGVCASKAIDVVDNATPNTTPDKTRALREICPRERAMTSIGEFFMAYGGDSKTRYRVLARTARA